MVVAWSNPTVRGQVWHGQVIIFLAWQSEAWIGQARFGRVWRRLVWLCPVWHGDWRFTLRHAMIDLHGLG